MTSTRLAYWYAIGSTRPALPHTVVSAFGESRECYRALMAGVMARTFGVSLLPCV